MAEELLYAAEIGAGVQEVRGEGMTHRVRRDAGAQRRFPNVAVEQSPHAARRDSLAAIVHEERRLVEVAAHGDPRAHRFLRFRSKWNDALLRSFTAHFHESRAHFDVVEIDADKLADAQSRRIEQFEEREIARAEWRRRLGLFKEQRHFRSLHPGWQ